MLKTVKARRAVEKPHVKKDDTVLVITGDDEGKKGRVLQVQRTKGMIVVEGVNYVKRHQKPNKKIGRGGVVQKEGPIAICRVALFCTKCNSNTRAKFVSHDTEVSRVCKACNEPIGRK
ncbi:MAG: 50S ribosomal protein L24 [Candidatus Ozemobacteraceae bacterium]